MHERTPDNQPLPVTATIGDELCAGYLHDGQTMHGIRVDILEVDFTERDTTAFVLVRDASEQEVNLDVYHPITLSQQEHTGETVHTQKWPLAMVSNLAEAQTQLELIDNSPDLFPDLFAEA